jgi:hypothetical protein
MRKQLLRFAGKAFVPVSTVATVGMAADALGNLGQGITSGMENDLLEKQGTWNKDTNEYTIENKGLFQSLGQSVGLIDSDKEIGDKKLSKINDATRATRDRISAQGIELPNFNPGMTIEQARNSLVQPLREAIESEKRKDIEYRQQIEANSPVYQLQRERMAQQDRMNMFAMQERMYDRAHQRRRDTQNAMLGMGGALAAILSA